MDLDVVKQQSLISPVETVGAGGGGGSPQIFAKVDLLPIDNNSEKKSAAKKHTAYPIPRKLLVTLLLPCSVIYVMNKTNFD